MQADSTIVRVVTEVVGPLQESRELYIGSLRHPHPRAMVSSSLGIVHTNNYSIHEAE